MSLLRRVSTQPDEQDGRAVRIVLTPEGIDGINQGNEVLRQLERELAVSIGKEEMRSLRDLLRALLSKLEEEGD